MIAPVPIHHHDGESARQALIRWAAASVCIIAAHGGLAYTALNWPHAAVAASEPPAAVMIELAPLPVAPDAPPQDVAVGPKMDMSEATTPSERADEPVEKEEPEPVKTEDPKPEVKAEIERPPLPEIPNALAVLSPAAPPTPQIERPKEETPKPPKPTKSERKKPQDRATPNAPATTAPQAVNTPRANTNAAPMSGMSASVSPATWRSALMAHLNRHKRFPPGGGRGVSHVVFTIDRGGRVLSARIAGSAGDSALDQEALALARRASPVPPPPPDVGRGGNVTLSVPVRFSE